MRCPSALFPPVGPTCHASQALKDKDFEAIAAACPQLQQLSLYKSPIKGAAFGPLAQVRLGALGGLGCLRHLKHMCKQGLHRECFAVCGCWESN